MSSNIFLNTSTIATQFRYVSGPQGVQGPQGLGYGSGGPQGPQGIQGSQGTQGNQGPIGIIGSQGNQGSQGIQGATGVQGTQGFQGTQGNQGVTGIMGMTGTQGPQGATGVQGNQGTQGTTGISGSQGFQGNAGTQGATGSQGNQGTQGSNAAVISGGFSKLFATDTGAPANFAFFLNFTDNTSPSGSNSTNNVTSTSNIITLGVSGVWRFSVVATITTTAISNITVEFRFNPTLPFQQSAYPNTNGTRVHSYEVGGITDSIICTETTRVVAGTTVGVLVRSDVAGVTFVGTSDTTYTNATNFSGEYLYA